MAKNIVGWIALLLVVIGGINWGLVGLFNYNLVNTLFGSIALLEKTIYVLVALSAVWILFAEFKR
ncbi:MAG: DUF378 domain-containing protein [Candidatus Woesearchaeota archaeon]